MLTFHVGGSHGAAGLADTASSRPSLAAAKVKRWAYEDRACPAWQSSKNPIPASIPTSPRPEQGFHSGAVRVLQGWLQRFQVINLLMMSRSSFRMPSLQAWSLVSVGPSPVVDGGETK